MKMRLSDRYSRRVGNLPVPTEAKQTPEPPKQPIADSGAYSQAIRRRKGLGGRYGY